MAIRYVRKSGSDSNGGTSPSDAWLTITKALGAAGISSGDTLYIGAGVYREIVTIAMTNPVAETKVIGDTSGAFTGDSGDVVVTSWLTSEFAGGSTSSAFSYAGRDNITVENIRFEGYTSSGWNSGSASGAATNLIVRRCVITNVGSAAHAARVFVFADTPANILFDQCIFISHRSAAMGILAENSATATWDIGVTFQNCLFIASGSGIGISLQGAANTFKPGGGKLIQCTVIAAGSSGAVAVSTADYSTSNPFLVQECLIIGSQVGLNANTSGQISEDWNVINSPTVRTNVSAGANSLSGDPPAFNTGSFDLGYRQLAGFIPVSYYSPRRGSALLGFAPVGSVSGEAAYDILNRPRPAGGQSVNYALGAFELHDTGAKEITIVDVGPNSIKLTGPADHDIRVPVQASATTITIRGRFDSTHGTTTRPQVTRLANDEIGVTATTVTMTAAADTWETLTIGPFTPTGVGIVTLRLRSRPAAGGGIAYFDTVTVT